MENNKAIKQPNNFTEPEWEIIKKQFLKETGQTIYSEEELKAFGKASTYINQLVEHLRLFPNDEEAQEEYLCLKGENKKNNKINILDKRRRDMEKWVSMPRMS